MARGTAAVALRLPLAPGLTGTVARDSAPSLPPPRGSVQGADKKREPPNRGARGAGSAAAEGGGEPAPKCADPSAQPDGGANRGAGRQQVPPTRGAMGDGWAQAEGGSGPEPRPPMRAPRPTEAPATAPRTPPPPTPSRLRPGLTVVVMAAGSPSVACPTGWAWIPDPQCGKRVSICPQPTRAPRSEVMALGPSWRWAPSGGRHRAPLWPGAIVGWHRAKPPRRFG